MKLTSAGLKALGFDVAAPSSEAGGRPFKAGEAAAEPEQRAEQEPHVLKIVVTGSECTGKTTLANELAEHYGTACSAEYARQHVETHDRLLTAADVEPIARGQLRAEDRAVARARQLVILDTDLVSTVVYARHYYGACPSWIEHAAQRRLGDLYLLLHPDVAWIADGLARDRPELREQLHEEFRSALGEFNAVVCDVKGSWDARRATAIAAIDGLVADAVRRAGGD